MAGLGIRLLRPDMTQLTLQSEEHVQHVSAAAGILTELNGVLHACHLH